MIISAIQRFSPYQNTPKYDPKSEVKSSSLPRDTFQLQKRLSPAFGSVIREKEIFELLDNFSEQVDKVLTIDKLKNITKIFFTETLKPFTRTGAELYQFKGDRGNTGRGSFLFDKIYYPLQETSKVNNEDDLISGRFHNEFTNKCYNVQTFVCHHNKEKILKLCSEEGLSYLDFIKKQLQEYLGILKFITNKWSTIEILSKSPDQKISAKEIFNMLHKIEEYCPSQKVILEGLDALGEKKAKDPASLIDYVTQGLLKALEYNTEKLTKVKIERVGKFYYLSFITPRSKSSINRNSLETFSTLTDFLKENCPSDTSISIKVHGKDIHVRMPIPGLD